MRVSDQKLDSETKKEIFALLYQMVADLKGPKEAETFLQDILSSVELTALAKRLSAACYLKNGRGYEEIRDKLKISSATIASIDKQIRNSKGFKLALARIEAEKWAGKWEKKIKNLFKG